MKKLLALVITAMFAVNLIGQTAKENHVITLKDGEVFDVQSISNNDGYLEYEKSIAKDYAQQIKSSALYRTMGGDEISQYLEEGILGLIINTKTGVFNCPFWWWHRKDETCHKLVQNKPFRNFMVSRICDILQSLCRLYPAATKQTILNFIDNAIRTAGEMSKHNYALTKTHGWYEYYLQKDGKVFEYSKLTTQKDVDLVFGIEGWIARRMLIDNISLQEITNYLKTIRQAIEEVDVSEKPMYQARYIINQDLKVFISTDGNSCIFTNGQRRNNINTITYMKDITGSYYQIIEEGKWKLTNGEWDKQDKSILFDNKGNKIHEESLIK